MRPLFALILCLLALPASAAQPQVQWITDKGGRVDWSNQNLIAFDRLGDNKEYDIYTMKPDGSDVHCLTCGRAGLPHHNLGSPAWSPSGEYLIFEAEKDDHPPIKFYMTTPGAGTCNDLWVMNVKTGKAAMLREVPVGKDYGILHPHFSFDGKKISWSEQYQAFRLFSKGSLFGYWKLMVADVAEKDGMLHLENIKSYEPGGPAFYENHGFSPDGTKLIFTHNTGRGSPLKNNIHTMLLSTGKLAEQLTDEAYNEHAHYSPDGRQIAWMSSNGNSNRGTDFWIMDADGSNKRRLTYFNVAGDPEYTKLKAVASDLSWSPDGRSIIGYVQIGGVNNPDGSKTYEERIAVITLSH